MLELAPEWLFFLFAVGSVAGFIDTLAGGGGMLTLPALMMSGLNPANALATNKFQGSFGTASATFHFIHSGHLHWRDVKISAFSACLGSACGTVLVRVLDNSILQNIIPLCMLSVALLFLGMPQLGQQTGKARLNVQQFALSFALLIGVYDGFLGPGTGSFFILALICMCGLDLRQATIQTKLLNAVTNFTSLLIFLPSGLIMFLPGILMAAGQIIGAQLASRLIISSGGIRLIRIMLILVSSVMSVLLAYRYWFAA